MRTFLQWAVFSMAMIVGASAGNAQTATQDINLSATVASYCTINGATTGAAINETIPVTNGIVDTSVITDTIANVACNSTADVTATSLQGGVTPGGAPAGGTTNIIDYTAVATFGGASSTIDTSTTATASGSEAGNTATTASAATGNLVVQITPAQPSLPLMPSAAYADTLRVTLTAN
jgi:hypothetical protein